MTAPPIFFHGRRVPLEGTKEEIEKFVQDTPNELVAELVDMMGQLQEISRDVIDEKRDKGMKI